jgi:hypothetical protein
MKFSNLMVIKAIVCLVFGIPLLLVPGLLLSFYGITLGPGGVFMARVYGASLLGNLMLTWFARNAEDSEARRAIVLDLFIYDAIGFVVALLVQLSGLMNVLGWSIVAIYLLLALGYGYFQFVKPTAS